MKAIRIEFASGTGEIEINSDLHSSFANDHTNLRRGDSFTHRVSGAFNGPRADYREYEITIKRLR